MALKMTADDYRAYREARERQEARYQQNWSYVHNGRSGSTEAWSYLRRENGKTHNNAIASILDSSELPAKALEVTLNDDQRFARAFSNYEFKHSISAPELCTLWAVYDNEGVSIDLFIAAIRESVFDGEKVTMSKLNRHIEGAKSKAVKYELNSSIAELFRSRGWKVA